jgi:hypothetical protein
MKFYERIAKIESLFLTIHCSNDKRFLLSFLVNSMSRSNFPSKKIKTFNAKDRKIRTF